MRKRIQYAQNCLKDERLVRQLITQSSISKEDVVYEIGAGGGIITDELLKKSKRVVAYEIDKHLFSKLQKRFVNASSLELKSENFLTCPLPKYPYKVFANIPFNITASVIKKLTWAENPPMDCYLIMQKEAAKKFMGKPFDTKNSQMAILLKPWFGLSIFYEFKRNDFFPKPSVDTILLRIKKVDKPLIKEVKKAFYQDFVVYAFNRFQPNIVEGLAALFEKATLLGLSKQLGFSPRSKPSELGFKHWLGLFDYFSDKLGSKKGLIKGSFARLTEQQSKLEKIYRTRTDKNWRKFGRRYTIEPPQT